MALLYRCDRCGDEVHVGAVHIVKLGRKQGPCRLYSEDERHFCTSCLQAVREFCEPKEKAE